jgi:hypothetical protein
MRHVVKLLFFWLRIVQSELRRGYLRMVRWALPSRRPRSLCKRFSKKKSLACYKLRFNQKLIAFEHYELYRITNPKVGEFYVFPISTLVKKTNRHLSYHKSGAFHWREDDGKKIVPLYGEADERGAEVHLQAQWYLAGQLDGYCLAVGPETSPESLRTMLSILDGYILPPVDSVANVDELMKRRNYMLPLPETAHRIRAQAMMADAVKHNRHRVMSIAEIEASLREKMGAGFKFVQLEPKAEDYFAFDSGTSEAIAKLANEPAKHKLGTRAPGFWVAESQTPKHD